MYKATIAGTLAVLATALLVSGSDSRPGTEQRLAEPQHRASCSQRGFEILPPPDPGRDRADQSTGANIRLRDYGILLVGCENPRAQISLT